MRQRAVQSLTPHRKWQESDYSVFNTRNEGYQIKVSDVREKQQKEAVLSTVGPQLESYCWGISLQPINEWFHKTRQEEKKPKRRPQKLSQVIKHTDTAFGLRHPHGCPCGFLGTAMENLDSHLILLFPWHIPGESMGSTLSGLTQYVHSYLLLSWFVDTISAQWLQLFPLSLPQQ